jgi:hypothetical protein
VTATGAAPPADVPAPATVVEDLYGDADAVAYTWQRVDTFHRVEGYVLRALLDRWLPDAALVLGPLYHLFRSEDRVAALVEATRVVRPGGPVQSLNRIGALRQMLTLFGAAPGPIDWRWFWEHGTFAEPKAHPFYAGTYWHTPEGLADEVAAAGLTLRALHGLDGPAPEGQAVLAEAPDWAVEQWGEVALALGTDPALLATSNHLLAVATAPGSDPTGAA